MFKLKEIVKSEWEEKKGLIFSAMQLDENDLARQAAEHREKEEIKIQWKNVIVCV